MDQLTATQIQRTQKWNQAPFQQLMLIWSFHIICVSNLFKNNLRYESHCMSHTVEKIAYESTDNLIFILGKSNNSGTVNKQAMVFTRSWRKKTVLWRSRKNPWSPSTVTSSQSHTGLFCRTHWYNFERLPRNREILFRCSLYHIAYMV